jgi:hypothetical protein
MATTYRSITVAGAAVLAFCLAVSFGPMVFFADASTRFDGYHAALAHIPVEAPARVR